MAKLKIDKFNGIYTNIDENELNLELFKDSRGFKHENGYVAVNEEKISLATLPTLENGYSWETGIYHTIFSDPFATSITATSYDVLVLVAKKLDGTIYKRQVWLRYQDTWKRLSSEGHIPNPFGMFLSGIFLSERDFDTTINGTAFFRKANGYIKLFLPHNCYWIGTIGREKWITYGDGLANQMITWNGFGEQWYIDRLVEQFDQDNLTFYWEYDTVNPRTRPAYTQPTRALKCGPNRRLGIDYNTQVISDGSVGTVDIIKNTDGILYQCNLQPPTGVLDFYYYKYSFTDSEGYPLTFDDGIFSAVLRAQGLLTPSQTAILTPFAGEVGHGTTLIFYPTQIEGRLDPKDSSWFEEFGSGIYKTGNSGPWQYQVWIPGDSDYEMRYNPSYQITKAGFDSNVFTTEKAYNVSTVGFPGDKRKWNIIVTALLDDKDEVIVDFRRGSITEELTKWTLSIKNILIPWDLNHRITRFRFYMKIEDYDLDYELYKEINLLEKNDYANPLTPFFMHLEEKQGIQLAQNIGFLFNEELPQRYRAVTGFRDQLTINGITLGISNENNGFIYHSLVGGGLLQENILLTQNSLVIPSIPKINAIANLNGNLGAIGADQIALCIVGESAGQLVFEIKDGIEFGTNSISSIAPVANGIALYSPNGIIITDGYQKQLISEAINDKVKENFNSYRLQYNANHNRLYFYGLSSTYYIFRFDYQRWEKFNIPSRSDEQILIDMLINHDGNIAYLYNNKLYEYNISSTYNEGAYLVTNTSDLGEMSVDKLLNYIDLDFKGTIFVYINYDNNQFILLQRAESASRTIKRIFIPLSLRRPFMKIAIRLNTNDNTTQVYKFELDFGILKRRF